MQLDFTVSFKNIFTDHTPHMSLYYDHGLYENLVPPESLECTQSLDCTDWKIIT